MNETHDLFSNTPLALEPRYLTRVPNEEILLYEGLIHIQHTEPPIDVANEGTVTLSWLPSPRIRFHLRFHLPDARKWLELTDYDVTVNLPDLGMSGKVLVTNLTWEALSRLCTCDGVFNSEVTSLSTPESESIFFHLTNSLLGSEPIRNGAGNKIWRGRLTLQSSEWEVMIDLVDDNAKKLLKDHGIFVLTHIGKIRRKNGWDIDYRTAKELLYCLGYFLSFLNGLWSFPLLYGGLRMDHIVWQEWNVPQLTPCCDPSSWWPNFLPIEPEQLWQAFDTFLRYRESNIWRDPIILAIHWYLDANAGSVAVEARIVLACTALELLSWNYLVNEKRKLSSGEFNKNNAKNNLRLLLELMRIPVDIPNELSELKTVGADGPEALFNIRNRIVHPPSRPNARPITAYPTEARWQALVLGLWYLELVILHLLNYHGRYWPRYSPQKPTEPVPWV